MPQPLKLPNEDLNKMKGFGLIVPLAEPEQSLLSTAYTVINSWSNIENRQLEFIIEMLGGVNAVATAGYMSLDGKGAKTAFLLSSAKSALDDVDFEYLKALIKASKPRASFRHKLAHWTIVRIEGFTDKLCLQNPMEGAKRISSTNGIYLFSKSEMQRQKIEMETIWRCYHYMIVIHNHKKSPSSSPKTLNELYLELSKMLLSLDKELLLPPPHEDL